MKKPVLIIVLLGFLGILGFLVFLPGEGNAQWQVSKKQVLPQFMRIANKNVLPLSNRPFSPDLDVGYVLDMPEKYDYIIDPQLAEWDIDLEILNEVAMSNLEKLVKDTEIDFGNPLQDMSARYAIIENGDGYAATHILSEDMRQKLHEFLGPTYIMAVPVRDFLIAWHPEYPAAEAFSDEVAKVYGEGGAYKLSKRLYIVTAEGIEPVPTPEEVEG